MDNQNKHSSTCTYCKAHIPEGSNFCPECGRKNTIFDKNIKLDEISNESTRPSQSLKKAKSKNQELQIPTWLICILFALWLFYGIPLVIGIVLLIIKIKQEKAARIRTDDLQKANDRMSALMTPEMQNAVELKKEIERLQSELISKQTYMEQINTEHEAQVKMHQKELAKLEDEVNSRKKQIIIMDDEILLQEFGLYKPHYEFASSDEYQERLNTIREKQKELIKHSAAATGASTWTVDGNAAKGRKMVSDMQKLLLRSFNGECDEVIGKVKFNNIDTSLKRITASKDAISKLGTIMKVAITDKYYRLKVEELHLAYEYQLKKQEEREAQKEARAEMREAAKLQKEIEEQRKKIEKEQTHYQKALIVVMKQLENAPEESKADLLEKKKELENELGVIDASLKEIDYREANQRAGYVYIISNIGAFGPDVYKIGMTRRLDPLERISELSDASVPFNFDVHAMIFSEDAPGLEAALHKAFEDRKVNMVNQRREFFRVTLDEIKQVVRQNFDKTVEFIDIPDAEQYRITQKMLEEKQPA